MSEICRLCLCSLNENDKKYVLRNLRLKKLFAVFTNIDFQHVKDTYICSCCNACINKVSSFFLIVNATEEKLKNNATLVNSFAAKNKESSTIPINENVESNKVPEADSNLYSTDSRIIEVEHPYVKTFDQNRTLHTNEEINEEMELILFPKEEVHEKQVSTTLSYSEQFEEVNTSDIKVEQFDEFEAKPNADFNTFGTEFIDVNRETLHVNKLNSNINFNKLNTDLISNQNENTTAFIRASEMRSFTKTFSVTCVFCHATYSSMERLFIHIKQLHIFKRPYHCSQCFCSYMNSNSLKLHISRTIGNCKSTCTCIRRLNMAMINRKPLSKNDCTFIVNN